MDFSRQLEIAVRESQNNWSSYSCVATNTMPPPLVCEHICFQTAAPNLLTTRCSKHKCTSPYIPIRGFGRMTSGKTRTPRVWSLRVRALFYSLDRFIRYRLLEYQALLTARWGLPACSQCCGQ